MGADHGYAASITPRSAAKIIFIGGSASASHGIAHHVCEGSRISAGAAPRSHRRNEMTSRPDEIAALADRLREYLLIGDAGPRIVPAKLIREIVDGLDA